MVEGGSVVAVRRSPAVDQNRSPSLCLRMQAWRKRSGEAPVAGVAPPTDEAVRSRPCQNFELSLPQFSLNFFWVWPVAIDQARHDV